jgi:hypothetical protein
MTTSTMEKLSHAEANASSWAETIVTAWEAARFCADQGQGRYLTREAKALLKELGYDGTNHEQVLEAIEEQTRERPLAVDVRSGWHTPGEAGEATEYQILLSTGGPALRIVGELSDGEAISACLQHQDWGTPWIDYVPADTRGRLWEALAWFAGCFWFGE